MTPAQMLLARRRLALGIVNVGAWVLVAAGGLWWLTAEAGSPVGLGRAGLVVLVALGVQAAFYFVGGALLMLALRPSAPRFLRGWLRGILGQTLVLTLIAALSYLSLRLSGGLSRASGVSGPSAGAP